MLVHELQSEKSADCLFVAERVSRQGDRSLGNLRIGPSMAEFVGRNHIGLLAERFVGLESMLDRVLRLGNQDFNKTIVVVYPSQESGNWLFKMMVGMGKCNDTRKAPISWQHDDIVFTSVEELRKLKETTLMHSVGSVFLLDPTCMVYKARSLKIGHRGFHDRPQIVVNFLTDLANEGVQPVFMLMTCKPAISLPTDSIARAFCREAWWFLDGTSMQSLSV